MVVCLLERLEDGGRAALARQQRPRLARSRPDRSARGGRTRREGDVVAVPRRTGGEARASVTVGAEGPGSADARRERREPRGRRAADGPAQTRQLAQAAAVLQICRLARATPAPARESSRPRRPRAVPPRPLLPLQPLQPLQIDCESNKESTRTHVILRQSSAECLAWSAMAWRPASNSLALAPAGAAVE